MSLTRPFVRACSHLTQSSLHARAFLRVCFLVLLPTILVGCGQVGLYSNLPEKEVNEMMAILDQNGIDCNKTAGEEGMWNLTVEPDKFAAAVEILSELGRPNKTYPTMQELFPKTGFVSSPSEQNIRLTYGLEQSLAQTVSELPGVVSARVHLVLPDNDPFNESARPSSASVVVYHRRGAPLDNSMPLIKQIVMGGVAGLEEDKVSVEPVELEESLAATTARRRNGEAPKMKSILSVQVAEDSQWRFIGILAVAALALTFGLGQMALSFARRPSGERRSRS